MGLALSMEGVMFTHTPLSITYRHLLIVFFSSPPKAQVMSSSYHICPTNVTFQFDTTFMYLIAVLMFMKLYQVASYTTVVIVLREA